MAEQNMVTVSASVKVDVQEIQRLRPDQIRAFFLGIAQVQAASNDARERTKPHDE
jgi:hypothetical protein